MKVFHLLYCLFLLHFGVVAQTLKGTIFTKEGKPISNATILVKEQKGGSDFSEFFIGKETGEFSFELGKKYSDVVFLEFTAFNYSVFVDSINTPEKNKVYEFQVTLDEKTQVLNEIIVTEFKRFEQHGDTTSYFVKAFRDGTERNIEDVLRKIPGVEVNEDDGSLKYLGKRVEAVQLDGDDLFGFRYSSATKNISADMIEKIDAIDHFNSNPLLNGLVESKTTALNLKLKKGKFDLAKNEYIGIGGGNGLALDLAFDLIAVSPKSKSYATLSYNNVGMNSSPFNFFSSNGNQTTDGTTEDFNAAAPKLINNKSQNAHLSERRSTINDQKNVNLNSIYKFNDSWSIRANLFVLKDKLWNEEFSLQQFTVNQQMLEYKDRTTNLTSPLNQQFELKLLYNLGVKRHFEWYSSLGDTEVLNDIDFSKNRQTSEKTMLESRDFLWTQKMDLSQRYRKHFFQFIGQWSSNSTPQTFSPLQNFSFSNASNTFSNLQTSHFSKISRLYKLNWIQKFSKFRMNYQMGYLSNRLNYRSHLLENQKMVPDFLNDNQYEKSQFTQAAILNYDYKKWTLSVDFSANKMLQFFKDNVRNEQKNKESSYLNFNLDVFNDVSNDTKIMLNWKMAHSPVAESNLFLNQVVNQNRGTIQNKVSLDLVENDLLSLGIRKDNLSKGVNQSLTFSFMNTKNAILSDLSINENFTKILYYQSPQNLQFLNCNYSIDKYIYEWKSNVNHSSNWSIGNSFNQINSSALRENRQFSYIGSLAFRTMRKRIFDIDNKFTYQFFAFKSPDNENLNASFNNSFKLILHPIKNYSVWLIWDFYRPNVSDKQSFSFLDCKIERKIYFRQAIKLSLSGKNILNQQFFTQLSNNSYSTNVYQSSLLPGYWMITANLEF